MWQLGITCHVLNGSLQVKFPEVNVLHPFAQFMSDVILGAVRLRVGAVNQLLRFLAGPSIKQEKRKIKISCQQHDNKVCRVCVCVCVCVFV